MKTQLRAPVRFPACRVAGAALMVRSAGIDVITTLYDYVLARAELEAVLGREL